VCNLLGNPGEVAGEWEGWTVARINPKMVMAVLSAVGRASREARDVDAFRAWHVRVMVRINRLRRGL
jgi:hypothetical protein